MTPDTSSVDIGSHGGVDSEGTPHFVGYSHPVEAKPETKLIPCPFRFKGEPGKPRAIVTFPDERLLRPSKPVECITDDIKALAADMVATCQKTSAVGLAAVQVGVPLNIIVVQTDDAQYSVLVNPVASALGGHMPVVLPEGCLSFPGIVERVARAPAVIVSAQDIDGEPRAATYTGLAARIVQHEVEHLAGETFLQHLPLVKRDTIRQRMKKVARVSKKLTKQGVEPTRAIFGFAPGV